GLEVAEFGESTVAVHAVPRLLGDVDCGQLIHDLLAELADAEDSATVEGRRRQLISALACKGAVKAGDRLSPSEIEALLARRDALGLEADACPHGRPTSLLFGLDDLERQFHRK
ncbi:MAG: DNA mismatch repair protein MutL, partial [Planctomycetota bacterium]